eukprot:7383852-Prymnesium_polylepis.1
MRRLHDGVLLSVPRKAGGYESAMIRAWAITLSADFPAAAEAVGTKKGSTATSFCRRCDIHVLRGYIVKCTCGKEHEGFPWQCMFVGRNEDEMLCQPCELHTDETRAKQFKEWNACSGAGERADLEQEYGIFTWDHGFTDVPLVSKVNPAAIVPFDFMHCSAEGMWKHELGAFIFACIRIRKWFSEIQWHQAMMQYPWPPSHGMPPLPSSTFLDGRSAEGERGGFPKINIHFHWTAAQECCRHALVAHAPP